MRIGADASVGVGIARIVVVRVAVVVGIGEIGRRNNRL